MIINETMTYENFRYENIKDNIERSIGLGKFLMQTWNNEIEPLKQYETRIVTLYIEDEPRVEGRYVSKDDTVEIRTWFNGEGVLGKPRPDCTKEEMIDCLATIIYDIQDMYEDVTLEWLGD